MGDVKDMRGLRFGRLAVTAFSHIGKFGRAYWLCCCDCGTEKIIDGTNLRNGESRSCGCLKRELSAQRSTVHGHTARAGGKKNSATYVSWHSMIQRCENPKNQAFEYYGGRSVVVCEDWHEFEIFLRHMGPRPNGTSLDRIHPNGDYEKQNCRWATPKEQANNRRRRRWHKKMQMA